MVLPTRETSDVSLSTMEELLEMCFGDRDKNAVDFRALHAILLLLARSMSLLERQVFVNIRGIEHKVVGVKTSIREVKISAKTGKAGKQKAKGRKGDDGGQDSGMQTEKLLIVETPPPGGQRASDESIKRPPLSLVTKEEYDRLFAFVNKLYEAVKKNAPEYDAQMASRLTQRPSLTDAGSVLQLSDRLRTTENTISGMMRVLRSFAAQGAPVQSPGEAKEKQSGPPGQSKA